MTLGPAVVYEPSDRNDQRRWVLVLNAYQRDNLLWLLNLCGYGGHDESKQYGHAGAVAPFNVANTGDWLGEVAIMLSHPDTQPSMDAEKTGRPNSTRAYAEERVRQWKDDR